MLRSGVKARSRINEHESQDGAEQIATGDVRRRTRLSNGVLEGRQARMLFKYEEKCHVIAYE